MSGRGARPRIGVLAIGLAAYWPQFPGLRERLAGYQAQVERRLEELGADVVSAGLVDDAPGAARRASAWPRSGSTWSCSTRHLRDLLAGAPGGAGGRGPGGHPQPAADGHRRLRGHDHGRVAGQLLGLLRPRGWPARSPGRACRTTWSPGCSATTSGRGRGSPSGSTRPRPSAGCAPARLGFLGHTYPGMLDMYSDFTQVQAQPGAHVEVLEIDDLVERVEAAGDDGDRAQGRGDPRRCSRSPTPAPTPSPATSAPSSSRGRRGSPRASTGWSTTSPSTGSPTTTAAPAATSTSGSPPV